jgi:hypothetical protein
MRQVHIECKPDELLVSMLGFPQKLITHHQGKSRVFKALGKNKHQLAIIDEDPGSAKTRYEKKLLFIEEFGGVKYFKDQSGNKIFILKCKLEDWVVSICKQHKIRLSNFGLPEEPDDLHDVINYKLSHFSKLLDELNKKDIPVMLKLKAWFN